MLESSFLNNSPINFSFLRMDYEEKHFHEDFELLYVFDGELEIRLENNIYILKKEDFLILNSNQFHSLSAKENSLVGKFEISYPKLSEHTNQRYLVFFCNSTIEKSSEYLEVRKKIIAFANDFIKGSECKVLNLVSKLYELLFYLAEKFLVTDVENQKEIDNDIRIDEIRRFVATNFRNRISIADISKITYLSETYLSKYLKKQLGMSFTDYLNSVRLKHAKDELLGTNNQIIRIAVDNGFANIDSFNKAFKDVYGMTPSKYRVNYSNAKKAEEENNEQIQEIIKKAEKLLYIENESKSEFDEKNIQIVEIGSKKKDYLNKVWNRMINIGSAEEVLRSDIQKHILDIKNNFNIKYVRVWDLYSPEMLVDVSNKQGSYNFHKLDKVLDFMVENDIIPYLELNVKTKLIMKNIDDILIVENKDAQFEDSNIIKRFITEFIIHVINRYGTENVSEWYFEYWKSERYIFDRKLSNINKDLDEEYVKQFAKISNTIKKYAPEAKVGGAGLTTLFGKDILYDTLTYWAKSKVQPDFLSFYVFPYAEANLLSEVVNQLSTNRDYIKDDLTTVKEIVEKSGIKVSEFHVSEWNSTASNRNVFNDACSKGAFIVKNVIDNFDKVDLMGYWFASDIFADFYDSTYILNGGSGLLSKDGIKKPAYYAFDFLNRLGKNYLNKGENYIATYNGYKEWGIVCHNYKFYNFQFFTKTEDNVDAINLNKYFENLDSVEIEYNLGNIENGYYDVKVYSINSKQGSLQDEWIGMSMPDNLTHSEIEYLKRICVPHLSISNINVQEGKLKFKTTLEANEIQYINIRYRLK